MTDYKLTPKIRLAYELALLKHELHPERYLRPDPSDRNGYSRLSYMANHSTVHALETEIREVRRILEAKILKDRIEISRKEFFEANPESKASAERNREALRLQMEELRKNTVALLNQELSSNISPFWKVERLHSSRAMVTVNMTKTAEPLQEIGPYEIYRFGYSIDMNFSDTRYGKDRYPSMNFGTMGSFHIYGEDPEDPRADFYIGVGKILENKDLLSFMEVVLQNFEENAANMFTQMSSIENFLDNPANLS